LPRKPANKRYPSSSATNYKYEYMNKTLKNILKLVSCTVVMSFLTFLVFYGQAISNNKPHDRALVVNEEVSKLYPATHKNAIKRSRSSSVRIMSLDVVRGLMSTSSATYFSYRSQHYVLTTSHGLMGGCETIQIEADGDLFDCLEVKKIDKKTDYAILQIEKIGSRTPIKFPHHFTYAGPQWKSSFSLMNRVMYTGYPNSIGPLTIGGSVMGFDPQGYVYVHSYAWSGSSGSGVFDTKGKLIGYIMAIDVGRTEYGFAILENVMLVVPIYKVDWSALAR
jgi:S1-C subfamily serine protease